jgi:DNA modification methylase
MTVTLLHGDNTALLSALDRASVQAIITSPPYYGLRDYFLPPTAWPEISYAPMSGLPPIDVPAMDCCLGLEPTLEAYVAHLVHVFRLVWSVLKDDGCLWLNLGDSYGTGTTAPRQPSRTSKKISAAQHEAQGARHGGQAKQLLGIPWRVAFALQAGGWYLRSDVIWSKPNPMPESVTDRPTRAHEYLFLFAKQERYYYNADAIKEPAVNGDPSTPRGSQGVLGPLNAGRRDKQGALAERTYTGLNERWDRRTEPVTHRNKRSVWTVPTQPFHGAHFACFPETLIEPCVLASSRPGDLILDPYGGSGTTGRVAIKHGRHALLMDLNPDYLALQAQRTTGVQLVLHEYGGIS